VLQNCGLKYEQCVAEAMQFLGLVQRKAADCHKSQDALHLLKELDSFQTELLPSQQVRLDEINSLARNRGTSSRGFHWRTQGRVITGFLSPLYSQFLKYV